MVEAGAAAVVDVEEAAAAVSSGSMRLADRFCDLMSKPPAISHTPGQGVMAGRIGSNWDIWRADDQRRQCGYHQTPRVGR